MYQKKQEWLWAGKQKKGNITMLNNNIYYEDKEICSSCGKPYEDCECNTDVVNPDYLPPYDKREEPVWR